VEELYNVELNKSYVHQCGATYHQSRESMAMIQGFFEDRVISTDLWPLLSPDLSPTDFLWSCLKKRVFQNEASIICALKESITNEIRQTDGTTLRRTIDNTQRRLAEDGRHLTFWHPSFTFKF
jgi:hypothetical protein